MRLIAAALAAFVLIGSTATAQDAPRQGGQAWYEQQLVDLAGVLGGSHYLRILCSGRTDQRWRDYMRGILNREPSLRQALSDSFNDGYRTEAARFPDCDSASQQTEAELRARGLRISSALGARGGN